MWRRMRRSGPQYYIFTSLEEEDDDDDDDAEAAFDDELFSLPAAVLKSKSLTT